MGTYGFKQQRNAMETLAARPPDGSRKTAPPGDAGHFSLKASLQRSNTEEWFAFKSVQDSAAIHSAQPR